VIVEVTVSGGGADWSATDEGFAENSAVSPRAGALSGTSS